MFYIVETNDAGKKEVAVVPKSYYENATCAWPSGKNVATIVKSGKDPKPTFKRYEARILHAFGEEIYEILTFNSNFRFQIFVK